MERLNQILQHTLFRKSMEEIQKAELKREYCLHGLEHSLDVARISYIINLEEQLNIPKDIIYGMALLHDIGRSKEYLQGQSHHVAGASLAGQILLDCGYLQTETDMICRAITCHKSELINTEQNVLCSLLYRADKLSRNCFNCKAYNTCYWAETKKNKTIMV
ncbi:MAG: HD domain-containing protein [Eubacteriales bacterium]|nr:HD domain-containing protein [Lachnospiraceae bacterium]MDO5127376.1 HD domain-containing protein [Eubacteriales bacterium]